MALPAGYSIDKNDQPTGQKSGQPLSIAQLKEQATKFRPQSSLGTDKPTAKLLVHLRTPSAKTTEESEHTRQIGNVPSVEPNWNIARQAVSKATEPVVEDRNTVPVDTSFAANKDAAWNAAVNAANVGGNVLKRAGRSLFGIVDFIPQTAGIIKNLFSSDEKVSSQAEEDLMKLHPAAQISDRAQEAIDEYRKSPKLAAENIAGDALALFLAEKMGKITEAPKVAEPEMMPKAGEVQAPTGIKDPQAAPKTIEELLPESAKQPDRRVNLAQRKRIGEMSIEELRKELMTSDVTGLPNKRAFQDAELGKPSPVVAMSDADGLKAFNDRYGHTAGDELLRAKAEALKAAGLDAYHKSGDEFIFRGEAPEKLTEQLEKAREILRNRIIEVKMEDGTIKRFKGADFSYGTGKNIEEADAGVNKHKSQREQSGEVERGQFRRITEVESPQGEEHPGAPERPKPWELTPSQFKTQYPRVKAGTKIDGRVVRSHVPNQDSIESSMNSPNILPGIREISMSEFPAPPIVDARTRALAEEIKGSGEISPLIVVIDQDGPYVLEGGHRYDALKILNAKSFPAMVVLDEDALAEAAKANESAVATSQ